MYPLSDISDTFHIHFNNVCIHIKHILKHIGRITALSLLLDVIKALFRK